MRLREIWLVLSIVLAGCTTANQRSDNNDLVQDELLRKQKEIARLEDRMAQIVAALASTKEGIPDDIAKRVEAYKNRPKREFVSVGKAGAYEPYVAGCLEKIASIINEQYPEEARGRLYGRGIATFSVTDSGSLESATLDKSTGHSILDEAFLGAIRSSAPFSALPRVPEKNIDILSVTVSFSFENDDENDDN